MADTTRSMTNTTPTAPTTIGRAASHRVLQLALWASLPIHSACVADQPPMSPPTQEGSSSSSTGGDPPGQTSDEEQSTSAETSATDAVGTSESGDHGETPLCEQYCVDGCLYGETRDECLLECEEMLTANWGMECTALLHDWVQCMIDASCVEQECWEVDEAIADTCECVATGSGPIGGDECDYQIDCGGHDIQLSCGAGTCECTVDGGPVVTCDAQPEMCHDPLFDLGPYVESCCGVMIPL